MMKPDIFVMLSITKPGNYGIAISGIKKDVDGFKYKNFKLIPLDDLIRETENGEGE